MTEPNVIIASEAAKEWGCTAQAVYNALDAGRLSEVRMGRHRMIVKDKKFKDFKVQEFGGRLHEKYKSKRESE